jgi:hypothetical protein
MLEVTTPRKGGTALSTISGNQEEKPAQSIHVTWTSTSTVAKSALLS